MAFSMFFVLIARFLEIAPTAALTPTEPAGASASIFEDLDYNANFEKTFSDFQKPINRVLQSMILTDYAKFPRKHEKFYENGDNLTAKKKVRPSHTTQMADTASITQTKAQQFLPDHMRRHICKKSHQANKFSKILNDTSSKIQNTRNQKIFQSEIIASDFNKNKIFENSPIFDNISRLQFENYQNTKSQKIFQSEIISSDFTQNKIFENSPIFDNISRR